jgi:Na+/proline symporter/signal transduction histidine kinase
MIASSIAILTALVYLSLLFVVAHYGDSFGLRRFGERLRASIYALTIGVYCTSWTFFGSVGLASSSGLDFLPIYIGPLLVIGLGYPFMQRIVWLARAQNITSVADFIAARFGKSESVAALVSIIMVIGAVPYIALQLKSISASIGTVLGSFQTGHLSAGTEAYQALPSVVAIALAGFAMAFGTRRIEATEHQDGLVLAIATESLIKLAAFLIVGIYVTWFMFDGLGDLVEKAYDAGAIHTMTQHPPSVDIWITEILLSACCIFLLPRQFQMLVVENREIKDVKTAARLFPLYIIAINLFVIPLALAGLVVFADGAIDRDLTVLALPMHDNADSVALIAMVGGLSAATAMVIVESVALSVMVSNDLVMPILLRRRLPLTKDLGSLVLVIRRLAIIGLLGLAYLYFRSAGATALSAIGLLSFAAVVQIAPAFIGGLFWRRATARGAIAGLSAGIGMWAYTLLIPSLASGNDLLTQLVQDGPFGIESLRPNALFGLSMPQLVHGVFWSLAFNIICFVASSLRRQVNAIESLQADIFIGSASAPIMPTFQLWSVSVTVSELQATLARYLGQEQTKREFEVFHASRGLQVKGSDEADIHLLQFAEHLLAAALGAASSRLVLSLLLSRRNVSRAAALQLIDQASTTLQYNRDLLQHALDFARQGITVFDLRLRLICWNREFRDLFDLPPEKLRVGLDLEDLLHFNAARGLYGEGDPAQLVERRLQALINESEPFRLRLAPSARVIEIRSARMPDGGLVTTYTDVTDAVAAEEALARTNETLEQRVRERTEELVRLNSALASAKLSADEANLSKTRFLAAASHDVLQPLNAARLYVSSLVERMGAGGEAAEPQIQQPSLGDLAQHVDASLEAVEEILTALLEMSRLDAGAMQAEPSPFHIDDILRQLKLEFEPQARNKSLKLIFVPCSLTVTSDRRLLRRLLQNLISNAIKYTPSGEVLVGCRRHGHKVRIEVWDTGLGIPADKQDAIFREFERLPQAAKTARGLGLGLSIVERLARVLDCPVTLRSVPGKGSVFSVEVPLAKGDLTLAPRRQRLTPVTSHEPLAGLRILAIDNEPRILEGMETLLSGWSCKVMVAADLVGAEIAMAQDQFEPDVVIADYHLDEGDGIAAIEALRARGGREIPALLITADRSQIMRDRAAELDIRVLNKPLRPAALRALLSQWRMQMSEVQ